VTTAPDPEAEVEANEADVLEQEAPVEERPPLDTRLLDDPLVEASEGDLLEQAQAVPGEPDDERR
jgi:hypothetical protein